MSIAARITRDAHLPYSPTILPYVVSGRSQPDKVKLRDEACEKIVEKKIAAEGQKLLGWRDVPVDSSVLGESIKPIEPVIRFIRSMAST